MIAIRNVDDFSKTLVCDFQEGFGKLHDDKIGCQAFVSFNMY